ncbi:Sef1p [Sugiyamaella lignohabitans]|uniref:Sef1p n=1 Tax=Sugiyamaella lignohabitans TaxID=796027 RepID=A0A167BXL2_9ASCO|nr:Sef1p [Sugiyamaella lignohabitans]ANB10950.1 Sef1p [Sugiyamaella lignohabitans]
MKAKACTECRQNKLRCLYPPSGIGSCQRCFKKELACVFDPKFRRVSKRKLAERKSATGSAESEIRSNGVSSSSSTTNLNPSIPSSAPPLHSIAITQDGPTGEPPKTSLDILDMPEQLEVTPCKSDKIIEGSISITSEDVTRLFNIFLKNHLYYMPLDICLDCEAIYARCELLFWTILALAGRDFPLISHIQEKVKQLLKDTLFEAVRSVEVVQALLLISGWPLPYKTQLDDRSFTCSTLALQYSMRLGLHRPTFAHEFSSRPEVLQFGSFKRMTTWMGCFLADGREAIRLGLPTFLGADYTLRQSFQDVRIPETLRNLCILAEHTASMNKTLGSGGENLTGLLEPSPRLELVKQYIGKLDSLFATDQFLRTRNTYIEVVYLTARLQVLSYILTEDILSWSVDALEFVNIALHDASRVIRVIAHLPGLEFAPTMVFRYIIYAALVLLRILRTCEAVALDRKSILSDLTSVYQTLDRLHSGLRNDEHILMTKNFLQIYSNLKDVKVTQPIKSRGPANIVYDAVRITREAQANHLRQQEKGLLTRQQGNQTEEHNRQENTSFLASLLQNGGFGAVPNENGETAMLPADPTMVPEIDDQWFNEIFNLVYYM